MLAASVVARVFRVHVPMSRSTTRGVLAAAMVCRVCGQGVCRPDVVWASAKRECCGGRWAMGDGPGVELGPGSAVTDGGGLAGAESWRSARVGFTGKQTERTGKNGKLMRPARSRLDRNLINQAV